MSQRPLVQGDGIDADAGVSRAASFQLAWCAKPVVVSHCLHPFAIVIDGEALLCPAPGEQHMVPLVGFDASMPQRQFFPPALARDAQNPPQAHRVEGQDRPGTAPALKLQHLACRGVGRLGEVGPEPDLESAGIAGKRVAQIVPEGTAGTELHRPGVVTGDKLQLPGLRGIQGFASQHTPGGAIEVDREEAGITLCPGRGCTGQQQEDANGGTMQCGNHHGWTAKFCEVRKPESGRPLRAHRRACAGNSSSTH